MSHTAAGTTGSSTAYAPPGEEPTLGALVASASRDLSALVRAEMELTKAEIRDDVAHAAKGAGMFGAAGLLGLLASVLLSFAVVYALVELVELDPWLAFLIVGVAYLLVAGLLAFIGLRQVKRVRPPERAIASTKETVAALKAAGKR
jgi:hypothetical protein